ncbi:hypothetical protein ACQJBY_042127 [Aegilops geniculata]
MDSPQKKAGSMDSPQKKAGSMDGKTPRLLPLSVVKKTPRPTPDVVRRVSAWALFTACVFAVSFTVGYAIAYALDHFHVPCSQSSSFLRSHQLTDAEDLDAVLVLRRAPGGRGGAGAVAPMPPSLGPPRPRLPRPRAHHRRPLHLCRCSPPLPRRRPRRPSLQDLLRCGHRLLSGGRHYQLPGPPPER